MKHFLSIADLSAKEIWLVLSMALKMKQEFKAKGKNTKTLKDKQMVMLFEKPSLRTKLSFDIAMNQLGGQALYFGAKEVGLGKREAVSDVAKVIASMADIVVARVFSHQMLQEFAESSKVPVINALSDLEHPCQALADILTIWEIKGALKGLTLAYIGDAENNITHSLALGCAMLGINFKCASPKGYGMNPDIVEKAKQLSLLSCTPRGCTFGGCTLETEDPKEAIKDADIVYTDTWVSMGDEADQGKRLEFFKSYQINAKMMSLAKKDAIFMHCLPAHRGQEVAGEVIDGPQSVIFQQSENRLHVQKALMLVLQ